ncbi:MAG: TIR domain-containing protein [Microthrixaceae bacterium]|nr:TIR domain-containing protein [Microthrixaceae bacterium]
MARRVFFSFHYGRDIWRANVVRNSWVTQDRKSAGFFDGSLHEAAKTNSPERLKAMIRAQLQGTSCTVVLIGRHTASRPYVRYEIAESRSRGNALIGVRIHRIKDASGVTDPPGENPFARSDAMGFYAPYVGLQVPIYRWNRDHGFQNLGDWVERAVRKQRNQG